jgi:hypothetical protein
VFACAVVIVFSIAVGQGIYAERERLFSSDPVGMSHQLAKIDHVDIPPIMHSISQKRTFVQTFNWYHTSWLPKSDGVPFWRPITMQIFWVEARILTADRFDRWLWVSICANCACLALIYFFVVSLSGRRDLALATVALYGITVSLGRLDQIVQLPGSAWVSATQWKNQEDLFVDIFILGSMIAVARGRWSLALICAVLSICCKETGWTTFVLDLIVAIYTKRVATIPRTVWAATFVSIVTLICLRASAGHQVLRGFHMWANVNWLTRYTGATAGLIGTVLKAYPAALALSLAPWALVLTVRRFNLYAGLAATIGVILAASAVSAMQLRCGLVIGTVALLDPATNRLAAAVCCSVWLAMVRLLVEDRSLRPVAAVAILCSLVYAMPYAAASQVYPHALHLAYGFQALFGATLLIAACTRISTHVTPLKAS